MTATFFEYLGWVSLSPNLKESFNKTLLDAKQHRHGLVEIEHLLYALVDDPEGAIALMQTGVDRDDLRDLIADHLDAIPAGAKVDLEDLQPARDLKKLMAKASDLADNEHDDKIDGGDVIRALDEFEASGDLEFLSALKNNKSNNKNNPQRRARSTPRKTARTQSARPEQTEAAQNAPQVGDEPMVNTPHTSNANEHDLNADPIKASIKAIMARRADAEEILNECEWYHLFKSLNMIDEGLEGEEQTHRAILLARAEAELAERPRCRKAFLYVRHLDQELARLKGIVDIDWAGEITPDETVSELSRLRAQHQAEKSSRSPNGLTANHRDLSSAGQSLFDVKLQESELLALEHKLMRLDRSTGPSQSRLKALETDLESHDTHSRKRENVIGVLERYLRSEMQLSDARDHRIIELEKELHSSKSVSDSQVDKTSNLETELKAFKEHAGNRELHIADLEYKLKSEKNNAGSHEEQVRELHAMLANEKGRAETHDKHVAELQKTFEQEQTRAAAHEIKVSDLETDLNSRIEQLQAREDHIKHLQENLNAKETHIQAREEHVKLIEADLSKHVDKRARHKQELHSLTSGHQSEIEKLVTSISGHEESTKTHKGEVGALRAQLAILESQLQEQQTSYSTEKLDLANTIDKMRLEIEKSEDLIEVIHATGEPYRVNSGHRYADETHPQNVDRKTIPVAVRTHKI